MVEDIMEKTKIVSRASLLPARKLPIITVEAPRTRALTMWPEFDIPPTCPRPTAQTSCVVQIDPDPIPTLKPSTPA
ncbi:hypothetical protein Leryth_007242 [Lithospermum erythrorhizon]|nr:hypothetical protein Leryth_007242 [Lithospermum erythrorhizon]